MSLTIINIQTTHIYCMSHPKKTAEIFLCDDSFQNSDAIWFTKSEKNVDNYWLRRALRYCVRVKPSLHSLCSTLKKAYWLSSKQMLPVAVVNLISKQH